MAYPPVVTVDANDNPVGLAMLQEAKTQGLLYRVVAAVVMDETGRILLQKRSLNMQIDPGKWDMSVGGHVDEGYTYLTAVQQEFQEELGLANVQPEEFGKEFLGDCFLMLYKLIVPGTTKLEPGKDEVADVQWFAPQAFVSLVQDRPNECAAFLKEIYARAPALFEPKAAA